VDCRDKPGNDKAFVNRGRRGGNRASEPLTLNEAKRAAVAMIRDGCTAKPRDWTAELNRVAAAEVDRAAMMQERKQWPRHLVGAESRPGSMQIEDKLRDAILDAELLATPSHAEPSSGNSVRLEFYDDSHPKLPKCLRRKKSPEVISTVLLNEEYAK
jgi:hypothetical protein